MSIEDDKRGIPTLHMASTLSFMLMSRTFPSTDLTNLPHSTTTGNASIQKRETANSAVSLLRVGVRVER